MKLGQTLWGAFTPDGRIMGCPDGDFIGESPAEVREAMTPWRGHVDFPLGFVIKQFKMVEVE